MFIYKSLRPNIINKRHEISCILKNNRFLYLTNHFNNISDPKQKYEKDLEYLINKYEDIVAYNSIIENKKLKYGFRKNKAIEQKQNKEYEKKLMKLRSIEPLPVVLKHFNKQKTLNNTKENETAINKNSQNITQFPFERVDKVEVNSNAKHQTNEYINILKNEISERNTLLVENKVNWMTDYENYDDTIAADENFTWKLNYGTPNPNSVVSNVPCGGCGALLHCKDTAIPGYIPSEIFQTHDSPAGQKLNTLICQRCHFLKEYDMALQVRVSSEDYPKILEKIKENKNALAILMVDLLDFPCSIWPNIIDIIGTRRPVVIVGNKVDLLPQDSVGYLNRIIKILEDNIHKNGLEKANIQHVALISAKTGYGVENLITKLHNIWEYRGDVYLIGCTNVGKSTLFNVLLQSDYCKIKAVDLIQRATTSLWPGTTLNLLKFPILRPSGIVSKVAGKPSNIISKTQLKKNWLFNRNII